MRLESMLKTAKPVLYGNLESGLLCEVGWNGKFWYMRMTDTDASLEVGTKCFKDRDKAVNYAMECLKF